MRTPKFCISSLDLHHVLKIRISNASLSTPTGCLQCVFNLTFPKTTLIFPPTPQTCFPYSLPKLVTILFSTLRENLLAHSFEATYSWGHSCDHSSAGLLGWLGQLVSFHAGLPRTSSDPGFDRTPRGQAPAYKPVLNLFLTYSFSCTNMSSVSWSLEQGNQPQECLCMAKGLREAQQPGDCPHCATYLLIHNRRTLAKLQLADSFAGPADVTTTLSFSFPDRMILQLFCLTAFFFLRQIIPGFSFRALLQLNSYGSPALGISRPFSTLSGFLVFHNLYLPRLLLSFVSPVSSIFQSFHVCPSSSHNPFLWFPWVIFQVLFLTPWIECLINLFVYLFLITNVTSYYISFLCRYLFICKRAR